MSLHDEPDLPTKWSLGVTVARHVFNVLHKDLRLDLGDEDNRMNLLGDKESSFLLNFKIEVRYR